MPQTVKKKIFCYNFKSVNSLLNLFEVYTKKLNGSLSDLKERDLIFTSQTDGYDYFLDIIEKVHVKKLDNTKPTNVDCYYKCILYKLRDKELPYIFNIKTGTKTMIAATPKDTIMEQTHFIAFPQLNLIISEYNYNGARIEKLRSVLDYTLKLGSIDMSIDPIMRDDNYLEIINADKIKLLSFKTGHVGLSSLSETIGTTLFEDLNKTFSELSDLQFEINITAVGKNQIKMKEQSAFLKKLSSLAKDLRTKKSSDTLNSDNITKCRTKILDEGISEKYVPIDLLEEKLVYEIDAIKLTDKYKYLDTEDMFSKLFELYSLNKFKLDRFILLEEVVIPTPQISEVATTK